MRWFLLSALSSISAAQACLWDQDTIASEKARFPEIPALISGEFPRHSREFYEWRKGRSKARIAADPSDLAAYDDLAVAQHKLGYHRAAIATMERKEAVKPGIYETYSNLGTFLIYTGDLDGALRQIDKALRPPAGECDSPRQHGLSERRRQNRGCGGQGDGHAEIRARGVGDGHPECRRPEAAREEFGERKETGGSRPCG
jgi:tetratricopeptide (TPR) repeat protein